MKMIINGEKRESSNNEVIQIVNMATSEIMDTIPAGTIEDAQEALEAAKEGSRIWAKVPTHQRVIIFNKFVSAIRESKSELAKLLSAECGKTLWEAEWEIEECAMLIENTAEESKRMFGQSMPLDMQPGMEKDLLITKREPLGVVVAILPFNSPAILFGHKVGSALASGNAVVIKPPEDDSLTVIRLVEIMIEAGVPGNVIQVVTGYGHDVGNHLVNSPITNAVTFTGSTNTGIAVAESAIKNLTRITLELGANDAFILCEDGDVDLAVEQAVFERLICNGQVCCTSKRFLIQQSVYDEFKEKLIQALSSKKVGNPLQEGTDVGPLINEKAAIKAEEQVQHTIKQGATLLYGGKRDKAFFEPTVLEGITDKMEILKDMEVFAPVFPLSTFNTLEEAINIVNTSNYGLNASIFTKDIYKAMEAGNRIEAGIVSVNGGTLFRPIYSAFGGYKKSGIGREGIRHTLEELTQVKSIAFRGVM